MHYGRLIDRVIGLLLSLCGAEFYFSFIHPNIWLASINGLVVAFIGCICSRDTQAKAAALKHFMQGGVVGVSIWFGLSAFFMWSYL